MRRSALFLICLSPAIFAADSVVRSGPFEIYSLAGEREAKDVMNFAEQLRYTLGWQLGNTDLQTTWPVRILVVKKKQPVQPECRMARDAYVCSVVEPDAQFASSLTRIFLDSWAGHLPPPIERGLIQVYSTIQIEGPKITLGAVPPQKDRDWSRAHMLSVDPNFSGKLRVMLGNLSKGVEPEVAYRNAFGMGPEELERAVDKYIEARNYGTIPAPSRPLNAQRQLIAKEAAPADIKILQADLAGSWASLGDTAEGHEGVGLAALRVGRRDEARTHLAHAVSARGLYEYAGLLNTPEEKRSVLLKAARANPKWAAPHVMLASIETHPAQKLAELKKATQLEPRNPDIWAELARLQEENKQLADAAKSWAAAERATGDPEARERIRQLRLGGERKRVEAEIAAREEAKRQAEAEMEALRNKALMSIRQAEARANAGRPVLDTSKLDAYKEGADTKKIAGVLQRVDCLGSRARLHVVKGRQATTLMIPDPAKIAVSGGGQTSLACGPQKPLRNVTVEYEPRSDRGAGIAGDAVAVEFR